MRTDNLNLAFSVALLALSLVAGPVGCDKSPESSEKNESGTPTVVASTTMLADLTSELAGDDVEVIGIMSPGGDPHLYQPTPQDARAIAGSDLVIRSGLKLEGWIDDLLENAGGERPIVTASEGVKAIESEDQYGGIDPHFWFEMAAWKIATQNVSDALVELAGPDTAAADRIRERTEHYLARVDRLDGWVKEQLATIPREQRVLITSHDAFGYFGRAYEIDVIALQGISTEQEASQRDVARIVELVRERKAPAVFVETSVNPALIEQVARETGAEVAGPLYSDSIGKAGGPAGTFIGTVAENTRMITESLGGTYKPFRVDSGAK
ncbi:MAG: metal ABC transporter substrate-binding protein [Myxococcota bacterium]